jgi:carbon monoxide dehydrogenase subunit G
MINFEIGILIDRPVQEVFIFLSNPLNLPKWQTMIAKIDPVSEGPVQVGSKFNIHSEMLGRKIDGVMEITEYDPPDKFGFKNVAGPIQVRATATLKPVGTGTKVTLTAQGEPGGVFKLAEGVLAKQVQSQMEDNLKCLKSVLESGAQ